MTDRTLPAELVEQISQCFSSTPDDLDKHLAELALAEVTKWAAGGMVNTFTWERWAATRAGQLDCGCPHNNSGGQDHDDLCEGPSLLYVLDPRSNW